jgi:hypothetical protein
MPIEKRENKTLTNQLWGFSSLVVYFSYSKYSITVKTVWIASRIIALGMVEEWHSD